MFPIRQIAKTPKTNPSNCFFVNFSLKITAPANTDIIITVPLNTGKKIMLGNAPDKKC